MTRTRRNPGPSIRHGIDATVFVRDKDLAHKLPSAQTAAKENSHATCNEKGGRQLCSNVIVLDDVTPQYLKASYALNIYSASLDTVLKSLLGASGSDRQSARS
jgi:hypothetical protein